ncbi:hypothetical protein [Haloferax sp. KTX1]|uniref:hypothetical protein n=1 Tax=Haloferax sp. KTX1 TaxID=2600597 RepID=UPI0011DD3D8A|nr:hypothetical protein [Haloferax sp. KTX1]
MKSELPDRSNELGVTMLASVLVLVGVAKLISIEVAGGFGVLSLAVWGIYLSHPHVEVKEVD